VIRDQVGGTEVLNLHHREGWVRSQRRKRAPIVHHRNQNMNTGKGTTHAINIWEG
jgi:hypothetical protein